MSNPNISPVVAPSTQNNTYPVEKKKGNHHCMDSAILAFSFLTGLVASLITFVATKLFLKKKENLPAKDSGQGAAIVASASKVMTTVSSATPVGAVQPTQPVEENFQEVIIIPKPVIEEVVRKETVVEAIPTSKEPLPSTESAVNADDKPAEKEPEATIVALAVVEEPKKHTRQVNSKIATLGLKIVLPLGPGQRPPATLKVTVQTPKAEKESRVEVPGKLTNKAAKDKAALASVNKRRPPTRRK